MKSCWPSRRKWNQASPRTNAKRSPRGLAKPGLSTTFASVHGTLRQRVGFDLSQLGAEYRALRASVLRLWMTRVATVDATVLEEVVRFNEGIDQGLAEAMRTYSEHMASSRDTFLAVLGHDLRSPLGALSSCVHLLGRVVDGKPNERALRIAKQSVTSISEMITRSSRIHPAQDSGAGLKSSPSKEISASCAKKPLIRSAPPIRCVSCKQTLLPRSCCAWMQRACARVLSNLLNNAVQHGDPAFPVMLAVHVEERSAILTVKNHGTPIPADSLQVIFNPLVQVVVQGIRAPRAPCHEPGVGLVHRARNRQRPRRHNHGGVFRRGRDFFCRVPAAFKGSEYLHARP